MIAVRGAIGADELAAIVAAIAAITPPAHPPIAPTIAPWKLAMRAPQATRDELRLGRIAGLPSLSGKGR